MFFKSVILPFLILNWLFVSAALECKPYGESCHDNHCCCGGCCLKGTCRDAYLDCRFQTAEDPCTDRYCPGDEVCVSYQPPGCKGCGPLVECRRMSGSEEKMLNKSLTHYHFFSSSQGLKLDFLLLSGCIILSFIRRFQ